MKWSDAWWENHLPRIIGVEGALCQKRVGRGNFMPKTEVNDGR